MVLRLVVSGALVVGIACDRGPEPAASPDPLDAAFVGLCQAEALAADGDVEGARRVFFDRSHEYLHVLAAEAQEEDPRAVGTLLERKERVEASLREEEPDPGLPAMLAELREAMAATARVRGLEPPEGCPGEAA